jgi:type IV pilus assembly protein PilC
MAIFKYKTINADQKIVYGRIIAFNNQDAEARLMSKGLEVLKLSDITNDLLIKLEFLVQRVKNKDLVVFSREFSLLISSNVSVVESLLTIQEQTENIKFKNIVSGIAFDVDSGALLSDSMHKHGPKVFSDFYINIVAAGETSGKLDEVLSYLADEVEKDYDLSGKFKTAMIYPTIVFFGMVGVAIVMMFFVMPQLIGIMQETGAALPLATRVVIAVINFCKSYALWIALAVVAIIVGIKMASKTEIGRKEIDIFKVKAPAIGSIFRLIYLIRFCRSFSTLIKGGVTMVRSLEISQKVVDNWVFQDIIGRTIERVNEGGSISAIFTDSPYVPKMVPQMMMIGEKTGHIDSVLEKISNFYGRELGAKLDNMSAIIEPVIMVVMGIGVGVMVAAIIMPMYSLAGSF